MGFLGDLFGGDAPDYSGMNRAAEAQAAISKEALDWYKAEYSATKPQREETQRRANAVSDAQLEAMTKNTAISDDYWKYQKGTFRPLEQGIVTAAENYDTPQRQQAEADAAVAAVQSQVQKQQQATAIDMARMGVNPDSGRMAAVAGMQDIEAAKAAAGADYKARKAVETQGYARKMDAANLGRNLASNQATSAQIANTTGNSAVANSTAANTAGMSGAGLMQGGFNTAIQANSSAGNLYGNMAQLQSKDSGGGLSALMTGVGGIAQGAGAMGFSSKKLKHAKKPVDGEKALDAVNSLPVEEWKYNEGVADEGTHVGPYAEDTQKALGDEVAPGGKMIDMGKMGEVNLHAIKALAGKLQAMESEIASLRGGR